MKTVKLITCLTVIALFGLTTGCKKDAGTGGKAHIHGHVEVEATGVKVKGATVSIWYGKTSADGTADATITTEGMAGMTMADDGKYEFENLQKGDYFLQCMTTDTAYTDTSGTMLMGGKAVTIEKKTEEVEADIHLE